MSAIDAARAVILGCAGLELTAGEAALFRATNPWGFILFARNCETPVQVRALVEALRASVGRAGAPVLIDQEGGRVQRLRPPHWPEYPPARRFGDVAARDPEGAVEMVRLGARLIADDLAALAINVDCLPCLDVADAATHRVIGDRAFARDPALVARLGRAQAEGMLAGGVLPVMKHLPGHGRTRVDSHDELPVVTEDRHALEALDFAPFKALADLPLAMTAHIRFDEIDADRPATLSPRMIDEVIRGHMGFDGLLMSDDISMGALGGDIGDRAHGALAAGCDVVLHCNGDAREMERVIEATGSMTPATAVRAAAALARLAPPEPFDRADGEARFRSWLREDAA